MLARNQYRQIIGVDGDTLCKSYVEAMIMYGAVWGDMAKNVGWLENWGMKVDLTNMAGVQCVSILDAYGRVNTFPFPLNWDLS